ncbi:MAG: VanW family protein [Candidatus Peribacteraceae bacterium]|nr:VanW family protein [Candidatus Peribacteraceae bacterium]
MTRAYVIDSMPSPVRIMKRHQWYALVFLALFFAAGSAHASSPPITYRYLHHLFTLNPDEFPHWRGVKEEWASNGIPIRALPEFRVDGDDIPPLPLGVVRRIVPGWNRIAIQETLKERIAAVLDRAPGSVVIRRNASGTIVFDGVGLPGRTVDIAFAAELTVTAIEQGMTNIILPIEKLQPALLVEDPALRAEGIRELLAVGESDYNGSPISRRHNIALGLSRFSGILIPQGAEFSFDETLGPVNEYTGYWKELVIQGDKTLPDYGGGLCQVSTTAYRGVWEYGFPILARRNHSFAVRYYAPQGTDATVYPPYTDMRFLNDSPGAVLIQTHFENGFAYFLYYGTHDDRKTQVIGPYTWGHTTPPPDRTEYTTEIPPGTTRKVGERVPGLHAAWYRIVRRGENEEIEEVASIYEARPFYLQVGIKPSADAFTVPIGPELPTP